MEQDALQEFLTHRPRLFALAYRMLGSASEAEDAVQNTYLRWDGVDRTEIRSAEAWLTTALVNLCRNELVSARARRENYVGPWLPEPVPTATGQLGPLETIEEREQVSLALLTALERLTPVERAVFVLREAFGYAHREIADMLSISEANSQQVFRRAGAHVRTTKTRFEIAPAQARRLVERFLGAARDGDLDGLRRMLADEVTATADGGGLVNAARRVVSGADQVARYLGGLLRWATPEMKFAVEEVNAEPAVVVRTDDGVQVVIAVELSAGGISALRLLVSPVKLAFFAAATERAAQK